MTNSLLLKPPELPASTKLGSNYVSQPTTKKLDRCQNRRSQARSVDPLTVPMAPWDSEGTAAFADLRFTMVRCVDLSDAGVAIVLPVLPRLTQACFRLVGKNDQPVHLLARIKN